MRGLFPDIDEKYDFVKAQLMAIPPDRWEPVFEGLYFRDKFRCTTAKGTSITMAHKLTPKMSRHDIQCHIMDVYVDDDHLTYMARDGREEPDLDIMEYYGTVKRTHSKSISEKERRLQGQFQQAEMQRLRDKF